MSRTLVSAGDLKGVIGMPFGGHTMMGSSPHRTRLLFVASSLAWSAIACTAGTAPSVSPQTSDEVAGEALEENDGDGGTTCATREQLLAAYRAEFDGRRSSIQAQLTSTITAANWSTVATADTWGPHATSYPALQTSAACSNTVAGRRELLLAVANYWVEQGINYCHHHIPGWTPPNEGKFRDSSAGSTSGGAAGTMTCTANRFADGHQRVTIGTAHVCSAQNVPYCDSPNEITSTNPAEEVRWQGVDCSDFTSWVYNFAGFSHPNPNLPTGIGAQGCDETPAFGALFDINATNLLTVQDDGATLESKLRPGDLLYILDSTKDARVAHVVVWSGLRWRDLRSSSAATAYDPAHLGAPGSRLGGDIAMYGQSIAELDTANPYMIVDSHYAGPAYRPFTGWYARSLTHVRRVLGGDVAAKDPVLAAYRLEVDAAAGRVTAPATGSSETYAVLRSAKYANQPPNVGYRLLADTANNKCFRDGDIGSLTTK